MTSENFIVDTSQALHTDGSWHIMDKRVFTNAFDHHSYEYNSVIYHHCRNEWEVKKDSAIYLPPVRYRITEDELNIPCSACKESCPERLQGLWKLHNFDIIQSSPESSL